jgi:hypothetical protein
MDLITSLIVSAVALSVLLVALLVVWALAPSPREAVRTDSREELKHIKEEIEHEAMEEVAPYKPARLAKPSSKRL